MWFCVEVFWVFFVCFSSNHPFQAEARAREIMKVAQTVTVQISEILFEASLELLESLEVDRANLYHGQPI